MANVNIFRHVGHRSWSRSQGQKVLYEQKGHTTRNIHVKYISPASNVSKVMDKVKVFVTDK